MTRRRRAKVWMSAMTAVLVVGIASCGADGPKTLSADEFVDGVDGVCRTASDALDDLDGESDDYLIDASDVIDEGILGLKPLKPPKELQADFDDLLANLDDQSTQAIKAAKAARSGDAAGLSEAGDELTTLGADSDDLTDSLGVRSCFGAESIQVVQTLSEDELIEQTNTICAQGEQDLDDVDFGDPSAGFEAAAGVFRQVSDNLGELNAPTTIADTFADFSDSLNEVGDELEAVAESGSFEFDAYEEASDRSRELAVTLGADACVELLGNEDDGT